MKATGIVRRIDELGRIVIPKEIRRTLRIRESDPMEIFTNHEGGIVLKKYSPIGELGDTAQEYVKDYPDDADVQRECTFLSTRHVMEEDSEAVPEETQSLESSEETTPES